MPSLLRRKNGERGDQALLRPPSYSVVLEENDGRVVAAHLEVPVDGPAADLLQEIVGGLEAPGPRERRRGFGITEAHDDNFHVRGSRLIQTGEHKTSQERLNSRESMFGCAPKTRDTVC